MTPAAETQRIPHAAGAENAEKKPIRVFILC
jgi:hypothetical protein